MITFNNIGYFGRLGNQMFQYAALVGIATKKGFEYGIPHKNASVKKVVNRVTGEEKLDLLDFFKNIKAKNVTEPNGKTIYYDRACKYEPGFFDVVEDGMDILGYFQSEKYFEEYSDEIVEKYSPSSSFISTVEEALPIIANKEKTVTVVNIRRGDYLTYPNHHPTVSEDYIYSGLSLIPDTDHILVASDDLEWCKEKLKFDKPVTYLQGWKAHEQLWIMSMCNHFVISNSSFSWWAAYLSRHPKKIVVAPETWFGPEGPSKWSDMYCKGWTVLPTYFNNGLILPT